MFCLGLRALLILLSLTSYRYLIKATLIDVISLRSYSIQRVFASSISIACFLWLQRYGKVSRTSFFVLSGY